MDGETSEGTVYVLTNPALKEIKNRLHLQDRSGEDE